MKKINVENLQTLFDAIDKNIGRKVLIRFKRTFSKEVISITGKIKTAFSNDFSPSFFVEGEGKSEEIFANEVRELNIL